MFIGFLHDLDQTITLAINSIHIGASDQMMEFFSDRTVWIPAYAVVAYMMVKRLGWKKSLIVIASVALTVAACDQLSNYLKFLVHRLRPCYDTEMVKDHLHMLEPRGGYFGFFSGHAANSFGFVTCSLLGFRNDRTHSYNAYMTVGYIWAAMVSVSRVFVGKHYFGDILVGAMIGAFIGFLMASLARIIINRYIHPDGFKAEGSLSPS